MTWIIYQAKKIINQRQLVGQTHRTDLLQLMLESASDEDFIQVYFFVLCVSNIEFLFRIVERHLLRMMKQVLKHHSFGNLPNMKLHRIYFFSVRRF
jgi:hypothetical protein